MGNPPSLALLTERTLVSNNAPRMWTSGSGCVKSTHRLLPAMFPISHASTLDGAENMTDEYMNLEDVPRGALERAGQLRNGELPHLRRQEELRTQ